ncbi:Pentatricopeptide repeat-containing protein [Drosera capensis]
MADAYDLLKEMRRKGCEPNATSYTILIQALCSMEKTDEAMRVFADMEANGCDGDVVTYTTLISGEVKEGIRLWNAMEASDLSPGTDSFMMLIHGCIEQDYLVEAGDYFKGPAFCSSVWYLEGIAQSLTERNWLKTSGAVSRQRVARLMPEPATFAKLMKGLRKLYNRAIPSEVTEKVRQMAVERNVTFKMYKRRGERDLKEKAKALKHGRKRRARRRQWNREEREGLRSNTSEFSSIVACGSQIEEVEYSSRGFPHIAGESQLELNVEGFTDPEQAPLYSSTLFNTSTSLLHESFAFELKSDGICPYGFGYDTITSEGNALLFLAWMAKIPTLILKGSSSVTKTLLCVELVSKFSPSSWVARSKPMNDATRSGMRLYPIMHLRGCCCLGTGWSSYSQSRIAGPWMEFFLQFFTSTPRLVRLFQGLKLVSMHPRPKCPEEGSVHAMFRNRMEFLFTIKNRRTMDGVLPPVFHFDTSSCSSIPRPETSQHASSTQMPGGGIRSCYGKNLG